jgi:NAD(P)-dependent dehydrogenase (short-subunit alcohol dehydrogenase family)
MISLDFKQKLVLVTGGGRGIGLAITRAIAEGESTKTAKKLELTY